MNLIIESDYYQIERDEVDIIAPGNYACYHGRGTVAICSPGSTYLPHYWFSKYPAKVSPTWNLVKLFDPSGWIFIFVSIFSVTSFLFFSARIGNSYFGIQTLTVEIILSPFRYKGRVN